ncbi:hypothetical protein [Propionivibrio sp.]|uniref:hypothetical protein n=1 Tax=Propionivibrio sp. TaxID=2212460 RepID=UPI003BF1C815
MATFPSYASLLVDGFSVQRESALLRTEMESGPPKQAKVKSRVMVTRQVTIRLRSKGDYQSFVTWFAVTLNEGAAWFSLVDPVSGATVQARFAGNGLEASPQPGLESWTIKSKIETWG